MGMDKGFCNLGRRVAPLLIFLLWTAAGALAAEPASTAISEERMRLGERMYREGILPSGEAMQAFVSGDVPVDGTAFTCVSCHLRSGLGSIEGEVVTPPTNGRILYQPREPFVKGAEFVPFYSNYAKYLPVRPAYTDESLAALIAVGIDPTGRSVLHVMPRYEIGEEDMAIMIDYLKALSDEPSPGVTPQEIRFATVIVEGTDPRAVESMLLPLEFTIQRKNALARASERNFRVARMGYNMLGDLHSMTFSLDRWILKGPPETWRTQLEAYYAEKPVFALLGGISEGTWEPVHRFCEEKQIPNLFPVVDEPVLSETDWYTLYFSRGTRQEGEAAARYLAGQYELFAGRPVIQVVRKSSTGEALADGFTETWQEAGLPAPVEIVLEKGESLAPERLQKIVAREKPAVLIVWDDASSLPALAALEGKAGAPDMILASGTYLGEDRGKIPEPLRKRFYMTYPYRLPREDARFDFSVEKLLVGKSPDDYDPRILRQSFITMEVLGKTLMEMRGEYYRDFAFDVIGMMKDEYFPLYERLSFGPGQRYASKGCYIVLLGPGPNPQLERRSEWYIQ